MKKKFLLGVIPALLALTSCAGIAPKAENKLFQEDALAHEEIFGEAKFEMEGYRAPRRSPSLATEPMYGVQYQVTESYVHMRLVAAVALPDLSVNVKWSRTMYKGHVGGEDNGHVYKAEADFASTKAYTSLANGSEEPLTIAAFNTEYGTSYDYFVVYTMLNIPKTGFEEYSIRAFISIDDVESEKGVAATVNQSAFATFDLDREGHFISGRFNGVHDEHEPVYAGEQQKGDDNNAVYYDLELNPGDSFALVYYDKVNNVFLLNGTSRFIKASGYYFDNSKKTITTNYKGTYTLYLNAGDQIHTVAENVVRPVYVDVPSWLYENSAWPALYAFGPGDVQDWFELDTSGTYAFAIDGEGHKKLFDPARYTGLIVVRMESGKTIDDKWGGKYYNQSADTTFPSAPNYDEGSQKVQDCIKNSLDGNWTGR